MKHREPLVPTSRREKPFVADWYACFTSTQSCSSSRAAVSNSDSPARVILLSGFVGVLGLNEENTGADELILKSNKEVPELLRAVRKLGHQTPRRRPPTA